MDSSIPKSERAEEAAVGWFMRQQSGSWTDADQARLDAWLDEDLAHRIQYLRVKYAWKRSGRMKALGAGVSLGEIPPRGLWGDRRFFKGGSPETHSGPARENRSDDVEVHDSADDLGANAAIPVIEVAAGVASQTTPAVAYENHGSMCCEGQGGTSAKARSKLRYLAAAASLLLLVGAMYIVYAAPFAGTRYSTPVGGIQNVTLTDGSQVSLNTDTRIRVNFSAQERQIRLDRGEAFFDGAKDRKRPFVVYVGEKRVMAVGTKFSVRRNDDEVQVVVTEGRVKLVTVPIPSTTAGDQLAARITDAAAEGILVPTVAFLDAGAIALTSNSEVLVRSDAEAEAEKLLSWRVGHVSFHNVPLAQAVAEFNRYNHTQIIIDDPAIGSVLVGGNFRSNNTHAFLDLLQSGFPITVEHRDDEVILRSR